MNPTPYLHLCWREYRSIRLFWIAVVALVVLLQWIGSAVSVGNLHLGGLDFNMALAFPALFAVGCAGTAFAGEKEEGTIEFLRILPLLPRHIVISKLAITTMATVAMYLVLWLVSLAHTKGELPPGPILSDMTSLWIVAALEAVAWGTFFSLLTARPLLAVVLAIAVATTETHLLVWTTQDLMQGFDFHSYSKVALWRALIAAVVLVIDVPIALRWLHGKVEAKKKSRLGTAGAQLQTMAAVENQSLTASDAAQRLLSQRDRGAILARLFWQQWRQSAALMGVLCGLFLLITILSLFSVGQQFWKGVVVNHNLGPNSDATYVPLALFAALMGCFVFRADQERRSFRFFAEHNIPPRYVWFSRQVPWIVVLTFYGLVVSFFWLKLNSNIGSLWEIVQLSMQRGWFSYDHYNHYLYLPPVSMGLACMAVSYAAGQFASILIRSGIMAGFFGLLLAGILCGWVVLIYTMQISFWWSVLPIPLALMLASWLRAPDWISENSSWPARLRVVAVVLIPIAVLCAAVPIYRVHQVPLVSPGFNPTEYIDTVKKGLATAELYEQALQSGDSSPISPIVSSGSPWQQEQDYLARSAPRIDLILQATRRPTYHFDDPTTSNASRALPEEGGFVHLLITSGRHLQADGKPDEALDRYFDALCVVSQFSSPMLLAQNTSQLSQEVFDCITRWATDQQKSVQQIHSALKKLQALDPPTLPLDDALKDRYLVSLRVLHGDQNAWSLFYPNNQSPTTRDILWNELMPWENDRALRMLNLLTETSLDRLSQIRVRLNTQLRGEKTTERGSDCGVAEYLKPFWWNNTFQRQRAYFQIGAYPREVDQQCAIWMETTLPRLDTVGEDGLHAALTLVEFEVRRRAAAIIVALEGYCREHGKLPQALADLTPEFFDVLPPGPYSGSDFVYFPNGLPTPETALQAAEFTNAQTRNPQLVLNTPGIWCMGPELQLNLLRPDPPANDVVSPPDIGPAAIYYSYSGRISDSNSQLSTYQALERGFWFPIPAQQTVVEK